jgi:uroporphyrinogen-III synthase
MRLLVTRPLPDARHQADTLLRLGHEPVLAPLLRIEFSAGVSLPLAGAQALIATSRNGLRALAAHAERDEALSLPLIAVGEATAKEAERLGFTRVTTGPGTGEALSQVILDRFEPSEGLLVHLAGETLAFDLKAPLEAHGFRVEQPVLYRAVAATELPAEALGELKAGALDGVILMSPRTAAVFVNLIRRHAAVTEAARLRCYCLSAAVAEAAAGLCAVPRVAAHPREEDVLALISTDAASL